MHQHSVETKPLPVILVHGIGSSDEGMNASSLWGRIPAALRAAGHPVFFGDAGAWTPVRENGARLAQTVGMALKRTNASQVIDAHAALYYLAPFDKNAPFGTPERRMDGNIEGFGIFLGQHTQFGTRSLPRTEVWYPQSPCAIFATWGFFGRREPNRRSWQKTGYQTALFDNPGAKKGARDTKSPYLATKPGDCSKHRRRTNFPRNGFSLFCTQQHTSVDELAPIAQNSG